jgi:hypothetical protein
VDLWKGLAQLAVGLTHAARGNAVGATRLLRRGADYIEPFASGSPYGIDVAGLRTWALDRAEEVEAGAIVEDPAPVAPRLRAG